MTLGKILTVVSIFVCSASSEYQVMPTCAAPDGKHYQSNTTFTTSDCLLQCVCSPEGHIGCVPLCPDTRLKCPIGYKDKEIIQQAGSEDSGCFCKRIICKPFNNNVAVEKTDYCIERGNYYKPGEEFIRNCSKLCRCYKKGQVRCVPLCPFENHCPFGATELQLQVPAQYSRGECMCKTSVCNPRLIQMEDKCLINGRSYNLGEDFVSADCTGYCKCKEGGVVLCVSLCPPEAIKCQHNEKTIELSKKVPNSKCTCPTWRCLKRQGIQLFKKIQAISNAKCTSESGNTYHIGQVFVEKNCTLKCHCRDSGKITCQTLCDDNDCAAFEKHKIIQIPVHLPHGDDGQSNCSCPVKICKPIEDKCIVGDKTYKPGDDFVSSDCSGYCKCYSGGSVVCASLCPPEIITCQPDEDKINSSRKIPNSNCTCPTSSCLKRRHQDKCIDGKNIYKPGDDFVMSDCSGYCKCHPGGGILCVSLCPPEGITCQQNEDKMQSLRKILNSSCTCPTWSCLKKRNQDKKTCITQSGKVYQIGQVFSDKNCTRQCHCEDDGKITCRPLCPNTGDKQLDCIPEMQLVLHDTKQFPDAEGKTCSCQVNVCSPIEVAEEIYNDKCIDGKNIYKPGDDFIMSDCSGYCKCHPGGGVLCVSLCPPEGIICQQNEDKIQSLRKIRNSNCTCPTWSCLKKRNQDKKTCITQSGKVYHIGQVFSDKNCTLQCHCEDNGKITCRPLCPNTGDRQLDCIPEMQQVLHDTKQFPDAEGKTCSCQVNVCSPIETAKEIYNDKCIDGKNIYKPGDDFVMSDCSSYCKCHPGGGIFCVSLCPPEGITCQQNEDKIQFLKKIPNSNCTCPAWKCVKRDDKRQEGALYRQEDKCFVGENTYNPGDNFVSADCFGYCKCHPGGSVHCVNLCPEDGITCQQNEDSIQGMRKIPDSNCTCPTWKCEKKIPKLETCVVGEHSYNPGDGFVSADCSGYCKCHPGGSVFCVSLCPPEGITCQHNEDAIQLSRKIPNSNCTCPTWRCLRKSQQDLCVVDGHAYKPGETFISKDCSGHCKCLPGHGVVCEMLCPPKEIICPFDEVIERTLEIIPNSNCKCPKAKCVKKKSDEFCDIDGVKYKIGQRFVDRNCTGYCKCFGPTAVGCVSLCPPRFYGPCKHGETQVETVRTVLDSHCTCPVSKCVKDGNWTLWSHWTPCDVPCGGGVRRRYRSCSVSGMCVGPTTETEVCNLIPCTPSYGESPCGSIRMRSKVGGSWPRCDDDGFFTRLQCNPITSQCWCVDKWGVEEQGSRLSSQTPQCKNKLILGDSP